MNLYNTLTRNKETFRPIVEGQVKMYVCGVTVYDECHLGHGRSAVVFDVLRRYLEHRGFAVRYVRNFTDIDDKIIHRANQEGLSWTAIVAKYIDAYDRDMRRLGVSKPDVEPRATDHMPEIIGMIAKLLDKGVAYRIDGDVFFHVSAYPGYGRLSGRKAEELLAGARVEVDERKKDPMDFALWKASKVDEPGWDSPWGLGRPGWHIECSAMSIRHLGETFDIHGGGKDLVFPHHENEIAQSCAYTGREFANYWVHNGFVLIDQEKMSKSLGNFFTIREIFEKSPWPEPVTAETLRYFLLSTHYRSDLNFSDQGLASAKSAVDGLYDLFLRLEEPAEGRVEVDDSAVEARLREMAEQVEEQMDDDLNTPRALAEFQRLRGDLNKLGTLGLSDHVKQKALRTIRAYGQPLGLFQQAPKSWDFHVPAGTTPTLQRDRLGEVDEEWIEQQITKRRKARERKDFAEADKIRTDLADRGIILEDRPDGTTRWKR